MKPIVMTVFKPLKFINLKKLEKLLAGVVIAALVYMLSYAFTSCAPKYGCGNGAPRQSWNKMVKRINSPK